MHHYVIELFSRRIFIMDTTDYWPFAQEYSIWNAAVTALQFWMDNLDSQMLSNATERVYTVFFCSDSAQHLPYVEDKILFSHFMTTLDDAFVQEIALEDIRYESGSESLSISTPLCQEPHPFHVLTQENLFFWDCHSQSMPISSLPQHSVPLPDIQRRQGILTRS